MKAEHTKASRNSRGCWATRDIEDDCLTVALSASLGRRRVPAEDATTIAELLALRSFYSGVHKAGRDSRTLGRNWDLIECRNETCPPHRRNAVRGPAGRRNCLGRPGNPA